MTDKGMGWNPYQVSIAECILNHSPAKNEYDYKAVKAELPNVPDGTIGRVAKALRDAGWQMGPPLEKAGEVEEKPVIEEPVKKTSGGDKSKKTAPAARTDNKSPVKPAAKTPPEPKPPRLAAFKSAQPAPTVFVIMGQEIKIDEVQLYESYLLYLDLKARLILKKDSFSDYLYDSAGTVWRILAARNGDEKEEQDDGGDITDGAAEADGLGEEAVIEE